MSDTAPPRPRPKPRPQPRPVNAQSTATGKPSGSSTTTAAAIPLGNVVINDSDDPFVINRGRTAKTWKELDKVNSVVAQPSTDPESDDESSPPLAKRRKHKEPPKWQNQEAIRLLSAELSDDEEDDSDLEIIDAVKPSKSKQQLPPKKRKRSRGRSRSRSITPPPEVPAAVLENARNLIRRHLDSQRAPSPTAFDDLDDSTDTIVLDPELERIAQAVNSQSASNQPIPVLASGTAEKLTIRVRWQKHPLNPVEQEAMWSYQMPRDESFRDLFDAVAEDAQILVSALVLSYRNKRLFSSTRPDALGLWGEVEFVGCHQKTYDYLQQQARELRQSQSPVKQKPSHSIGLDDDSDGDENVINILSDDEDEDNITVTDPNIKSTYSTNTTTTKSPPPRASQESDAESESDSGKFKLVLRSNRVAKDITLIVRPTTKCGAIVRAYIKKAGLADQYPHVFEEDGASPAPTTTSRGNGRSGRGGGGRSRGRGKAQTPVQVLPDPRISVDGDRMDNGTEIGEADPEDGDMVEVVGL